MPRPTDSSAVSRPDLGVVAYEYLLEASQRGFIGTRVLPIFETMEPSAEYPIIPIESLLKRQDTTRTPRGDYNRGDWNFEMGLYACEEHGWEEPIDDAEARMYQRFFDAEVIATEICVDRILRNHEARVAALAESRTPDNTLTTPWSTSATATPYEDVEAEKDAMRAASGLLPNVLAMAYTVFTNALRTAEVRDALKYTSPIELGGLEAKRQILAQYFGVDEILVGNAQQDVSKKGQSFLLDDVWSSDFLHLLRVSDGSMRLREPVFGRTFLWSSDSDTPMTVEDYREEQKRAQIIRARNNVDEAIIFADAQRLVDNLT